MIKYSISVLNYGCVGALKLCFWLPHQYFLCFNSVFAVYQL